MTDPSMKIVATNKLCTGPGEPGNLPLPLSLFVCSSESSKVIENE